jgi:hypothetical protein
VADSSGKVATYSLKLDSNAGEVSAKEAAEVEALRASIQKAGETVKAYSAANRALVGTSEEVSKAKATLKARIDAEKGAISQGNLALLKMGTSYEQLGQKMRAAEAEQKKLDAKKQAATLKELAESAKGLAAFQKYSGGVGELAGKLGEFKKAANEGKLGALALGLGIGVLAAGVAGLAGALADGAVKLVGWTLGSANALRTMGLLREATTGSAEGAKNLGEQVDKMARQVSTSKEKLNDLGVSITKTLSGGVSRAGPETMGRAIVSTFEAVSRASDAMGDEVGKQIQGILTRGKMMGRTQLSAFDLEGTTLQFQDVAKALASNMKIGVKQAQEALYMGRVNIDDGAKAMADAVNARWGTINAKKLLDLDVITQKFGETWRGLTKDIPVEKIGEAFKEITDIFDASSFEGQQIKQIFQDMGLELGSSMKGTVPLVREAVDEVILGALKMELAFYNARKAMGGKEVFNKEVWSTAKNILSDVGTAAWDVAKAVLAIANAWQKWDELAKAGSFDVPVVGDVGRAQSNADSKLAAWQKDHPGARNPLLEQEAAQVKGHAKGGVVRKPDSGEVFVSASPGETIVPAGMALVPRGGGAGGAGGGTSRLVVEVTVRLEGGGQGMAAAVAQELGGRGFLSDLSKAIRQTLVTQGIPTQAPVLQ